MIFTEFKKKNLYAEPLIIMRPKLFSFVVLYPVILGVHKIVRSVSLLFFLRVGGTFDIIYRKLHYI